MNPDFIGTKQSRRISFVRIFAAKVKTIPNKQDNLEKITAKDTKSTAKDAKSIAKDTKSTAKGTKFTAKDTKSIAKATTFIAKDAK